MTTPRDTDDLASALLDGLLTDDEAAAARRDPAVAARLAALAAVREEVGRPPARPDPVARERGLAAALAAFDAGDVADERRAVTESVGAAVSPRGRGRTGLQPATSRTGTPWRAHGSARRRWLTALLPSRTALLRAPYVQHVILEDWLLEQKVAFRDLERAAAEAHLARLRVGTPESLETTSLHLDILRDLKRINSHLTSVAYPILDAAGELVQSRLRTPASENP